MIPEAWFENPELPGPAEQITVTDKGYVSGHLLHWENTPEIGGSHFPGPSPTNYSWFHTHPYPSPHHHPAGYPLGPDRLRVGMIQLMNDTIVAYVRAGDDAHGLWVAGGLVPGLPRETGEILRSGARLSGGWWFGELTEIRVVNQGEIPGYLLPDRSKGV